VPFIHYGVWYGWSPRVKKSRGIIQTIQTQFLIPTVAN
jgi:hypothetical protein